MKDRRMIIATITEYGSDEDTEIGSRVLRSMADSYMRRPAVADEPMRMISVMANNDLALMRDTGERIECDAAVAFLYGSKARFFLSGAAAAYHFEQGRLAHRTRREEGSVIGRAIRFEPTLEEAFTLKPGKNAILTASPGLGRSVSDRALEEALNESETPEEWMHHIEGLLAPDTRFCAVAAFLPDEKPSLLRKLLRHE